MFIVVFETSYQRFIGEGETIAEAIVDLEGYMEKEGFDPCGPDNYTFYSVKPIKVKLEYLVIE